MSEEQVYVERKREYRPFAELSRAHDSLLSNLREQRGGCPHEAMACLIVAAFKFEALLNQVGNEVVDGWENVERISVRDKAGFLAKQVDLILDWGCRPLQTINEILRARDELAHAKPAVLETAGIESGEREEIRRARPQLRWEQLCTLEFAERADKDTEAFAEQLAQAAGLGRQQLRSSGHSYTISHR